MSADGSRTAEQDFDAVIGPLVESGLRLAFSMLGDRAEAEDATQEAITKAWRSLARLRDRSQVRPWFLAIVANQCRNVRRTHWFRTLRLPTFYQSARGREVDVERLDLERAMERLSLGDRQALFMHFYLDLPIEEVAIALNLSPAAAKGRVYRACRRLRPGLVEEDI